MDYKVTTLNNSISLSLTNPTYVLSLSRTGGQGSKGDSVSNSYFDEDNNLIMEISDGAGVVISELNLGTIPITASLEGLTDVDLTNIQNNDYLAYNSTTGNYENHALTTYRVTDIDNTSVTDGAILVYNGTSNKYEATTELQNTNTIIRGGTY